MGTYVNCGDCSGQISTTQFDPISVPKLDEDGFPNMLMDGSVEMVTLQLPRHKVNHPESVRDLGGLAPAPCLHGLPEHPKGFPLKFGNSWIRPKYLFTTAQCVVCRGMPQPADFTEAMA